MADSDDGANEDELIRDGSHASPTASLHAAVRFVLVEPQLGGNVGAAARALKNLGFDRLIAVTEKWDPRTDEDARRMAKDARDVLGRMQVLGDLDAALDGATAVIGTSRRRGKHRQPHWRLDRFAPEMARLAGTGGIAVLFGREAHGLSDAELDRCTHLVHFPSGDAYPSFNLAQSVLLVAYQLRLAMEGPLLDDASTIDPPADHAMREAMYQHFGNALEAIGFLHADTVEPMMRRIRRMLGRAELTANEARIVRGIARQMLWLSRQAGIEPPPPSAPEDP
jgi:tRNA/rRNA methyltransferase